MIFAHSKHPLGGEEGNIFSSEIGKAKAAEERVVAWVVEAEEDRVYAMIARMSNEFFEFFLKKARAEGIGARGEFS